ncbi:MAG: pyridoxal phosphate-dependent aminotransferase [Thermoplasmata archaeon]
MELTNLAKSEIINKIYKMKEEGKEIISLAVGELEIPTPKEIIDIAYESMKNGQTHYASPKGLTNFRNVALHKVKNKNKINGSIDNIIFISAKHSIFSAIMSIQKRGKEILIPDPGYFYSEPIIMAGMKTVYYKHNDVFNPDLNDLESKINENTVAIILNSPSNPTGKIIDENILKKIYEISKNNQIYVISDEAYEDIIYEKESLSIGSLEREPEYVISIFSLSKSYSMTGWRAGYTVAPKEIINKISKIIEHTITSYPPFIQEASSFAIQNCGNFIKKIRLEMKTNRDFALKRIKEIDALTANEIEGTFYAFPKLNFNMDSLTISERLLEKYKVATLPGISFGPSGEGRIRISFSRKIDDLEVGFDLLEKFLKKELLI